MKRVGNLYDRICSIENLQLADAIASQGKSKQYGVIIHNKNKEANILKLHEMLVNQTFTTSPYSTFTIYEPKERIIYSLPYYPDRIVHHAVMNVLEPIFMSVFTAFTYSSIKGRGIYGAYKAVKNALKDKTNTQYCLKFDIKKFYPSIDHEILKQLLRKKIKCAKTLWLLDTIIDSAEGVPIGNYLSQYFANFYVTYLDHWLKEKMAVKHCFRYADDYVILHSSTEYLHQLFADIKEYLQTELKLTIKSNYQVFPVAKRGIDFVGFKFYSHTYILIRKSIKQAFARKVAKGAAPATIASYTGWLKHCNSKHLIKKLLPKHV